MGYFHLLVIVNNAAVNIGVQDFAIQSTIRLGGLNNRSLLSHHSGGWKSKIKVLAGLVSPDGSLLGLQTAAFFLCPHVAFPLCTHIPGVSLCPDFLFS